MNRDQSPKYAKKWRSVNNGRFRESGVPPNGVSPTPMMLGKMSDVKPIILKTTFVGRYGAAHSMAT